MLRRSLGVALVSFTLVAALAQPAVGAPANGRIVFKRDVWPSAKIVSVEPDGSDPQVAFVDDSKYWDNTAYRMALSTDGTRLLMAQSHENNFGSAYLSRLVTVDAADGGNLVVVVPPEDSFFASVAWYPDGSRVLFTMAVFGGAGDGRYRLYSVLPDGSDLMQIGGGVRIDAAMSPDLSTIVYRDGKERIGVMDADGGNPTILFGDGRNFDPRWAPDGSRIAISRQMPGTRNADIYTAAPDGSDLFQVLDTPRLWESDPVWSPDGARLLFARDVGGRTGSFNIDLFTVGADGTGVDRVTETPAVELHPNWAPAT